MTEQRKYVGARYVPLIMGEWDSTATYEPLSIVLYNGKSYTSRTFVPANIPITNEVYWALSGNYNVGEDGYAKSYETVADMQADTTLTAGMIAYTLGFHAVGDGGAAWYLVESTGTANGMDVLALSSGVAVLQVTESYVTPEMFGAYGDGVHDDASCLQYALSNFARIEMGKKTYLISSTLTIPSTPVNEGGSKGTILIGDFSETFINYIGSGNFLEINGKFYCENIRVENKDLATNGVLISSSWCCFKNCQFNGFNENGILFDETKHIVHCIIDGVTCYGNKKNGVKCVTNTTYQKTAIRFINCYFVGNGSETSNTTAQTDGDGNGALLGACLGVSVINTVFEYNHGSGVLLKNVDAYGIFNATIIANYFEGNRLANVYLNNANTSLAYKQILVKSNYYSTFVGEGLDTKTFTNTLTNITEQTYIQNPSYVTESIIDNSFYAPEICKKDFRTTIYPNIGTVQAGSWRSVTVNKTLWDNPNIPIDTSKSIIITSKTQLSYGLFYNAYVQDAENIVIYFFNATSSDITLATRAFSVIQLA